MKKRNRVMLAFWLGVASFVSSVGAVYTPQTAQAAVSSWQKGVTYQGYYNTEYASSQFQAAMNRAAADGANYVTLVVPYHQDNLYTANVYAAGDTPTDQALVSGIQYIHSLGMKVMLKPHVDSNTGEWRAGINPSDRATWFQTYGDLLTHLAAVGTQNGVEQICVGAELVSMTRPDRNASNTQNWSNLIDRVRTVYSGSLTYSAQRADGSSVDEVSTIQFWNKLSYIGVSAYYPLDGSSVAAMENSWRNIDTQSLQPVVNRTGKSLLFTEVGYRSASNAASAPYDYNNGSPDQTLQANLYQAMFEYWNTRSYMAGVALWDWNSQGDTSYNPQYKAAENVLKTWFGGQTTGGGTPTPTPSATPTPTPTPTATPVPVNTNPGSLTTSATTVPASPMPGQATSVKTSVTPQNTASGVLVDTEIYDQNNNRVWQQYVENQTVTAGKASVFTANWTPSSVGTYTIKVGVFSSGWSQNYSWNDTAGSVKVATAATPTPTPSATPTPTPSATPTPTPSATSTPTPSATPTPTPSATPTPTPSATPTPTPTTQPQTLSVWWPGDGVTVQGVQPFKARMEGLALGAYQMFWQVDGGVLNGMGDSNQDGPHKESLVDLSGWYWQSNGRYKITFVAKDLTGKVLATKDVIITVAH